MNEGELSRVPELDGLEAVEIARRLEWMDGLLFFDTAGNVPSGWECPVSIVAASPTAIHEGSIFREEDRNRLAMALAEKRSVDVSGGFFAGGLCGWVSYEGDFVFGEYERLLIRDERSGEWWGKGGLESEFRRMTSKSAVIGEFSEEMGRENFLSAVEKVKEYIAAGDIYQVNVAQGFCAEVSESGGLFGLYEVLRKASPAPMGIYQKLAGREILGTSPELFLKVSGNRIETRPIKGTRPRFPDKAADMASVMALRSSPKEVSELVMITDLLRNDLGKVCDFGSVEVTDMLRLESLAQVHHLVSSVVGRLREDESALSALEACFPGGSITGAPKKRAMEIIQELEKSPRGIYCGAMGWLGFDGESEFNIAIRTLVRDGGTLRYQVGAGIVADSVPEEEYAETLQKGMGIRLAVDEYRAGPQVAG
ncbi:anthranilate synthase component I family protein [Luteolibacter sp. AS25]|uniref:anthranilate synthase component I family protein n=1 Tax=Luteolibacter sp. AS25 TaxID=3135776 RepID=UPI00398AF15D